MAENLHFINCYQKEQGMFSQVQGVGQGIKCGKEEEDKDADWQASFKNNFANRIAKKRKHTP